MLYAAKTGEPQQGEPATKGYGLEMWRFYSSIMSWRMISVKPTRSVNKIAVSLRLTSLKIEFYCNEY